MALQGHYYYHHLVLVVLLLPQHVPEVVQAFPNFRDEIPNGDRVRSPCIPFFNVPAAGHVDPFGGGARNAFGQAFAGASYQWTTALCQADSDGDGRTNGDELGDPNCNWSQGQTPERASRITHPCYNNSRPDCIRRFLEHFSHRRQ